MEKAVEIRIAILKSIQDNSQITGFGYVSLTAIREDCSMYQRVDLDAQLIAMFEDGTINLIPESVQRNLRPQDRKAALWAGGQEKHLATIC